jgi:hypothetical protein
MEEDSAVFVIRYSDEPGMDAQIRNMRREG